MSRYEYALRFLLGVKALALLDEDERGTDTKDDGRHDEGHEKADDDI